MNIKTDKNMPGRHFMTKSHISKVALCGCINALQRSRRKLGVRNLFFRYRNLSLAFIFPNTFVAMDSPDKSSSSIHPNMLLLNAVYVAMVNIQFSHLFNFVFTCKKNRFGFILPKMDAQRELNLFIYLPLYLLSVTNVHTYVNYILYPHNQPVVL